MTILVWCLFLNILYCKILQPDDYIFSIIFVTRHYFALATNPGEQFFTFTSLAAWLLTSCGRNFEQPQEVTVDPFVMLGDRRGCEPSTSYTFYSLLLPASNVVPTSLFYFYYEITIYLYHVKCDISRIRKLTLVHLLFPQYDDPNATVSNILDEMKKLVRTGDRCTVFYSNFG